MAKPEVVNVKFSNRLSLSINPVKIEKLNTGNLTAFYDIFHVDREIHFKTPFYVYLLLNSVNGNEYPDEFFECDFPLFCDVVLTIEPNTGQEEYQNILNYLNTLNWFSLAHKALQNYNSLTNIKFTNSDNDKRSVRFIADGFNVKHSPHERRTKLKMVRGTIEVDSVIQKEITESVWQVPIR